MIRLAGCGSPHGIRGNGKRVTWRVVTKDGSARPGMLNDLLAVSPGQRNAQPEMVGRAASLRLLSHSGQAVAKFVLAQPRLQLAVAQSGLTH